MNAKKSLLFLTALVLVAVVTWKVASHRQPVPTLEPSDREAELQAETARLRMELERARLEAHRAAPVASPAALQAGRLSASVSTNLPAAPSSQNAEAVIARLVDWSLDASTNKQRNTRQLIAQLEKLVEMGPAAVPAIRDFLARNEDVVFANDGPPPGKGPKWKQDAALPASLRDGLIDSLKRIGGPEAESLLAQSLTATGRGYEVLTIAGALEQIAPGKYRDAALSAAQTLLAAPATGGAATRLDAHSREYLYDVLARYGDANTLAQVGGQLVSANGTVDEAALKLFEKVPASASLPAVYQALKDPRLTDPRQREPLLEVAMNHVGADAQAGELFLSVMQSAGVSPRLQEKALRHLAGEGLENEDAPTARDLGVLQSRLQYLDTVRPALTDPKLVAELDKTRAKIVNRIAPPKKP